MLTWLLRVVEISMDYLDPVEGANPLQWLDRNVQKGIENEENAYTKELKINKRRTNNQIKKNYICNFLKLLLVTRYGAKIN